MSTWMFLVVGLLILINALYVAAEFAIVGARVSRVEHVAGQGHRLAAALLPIIKDTASLDRYIAACQSVMSLSSLLLGAFGQATIGVAIGEWLVAYRGLEPLGAHALSATLVLVVLTSAQVVPASHSTAPGGNSRMTVEPMLKRPISAPLTRSTASASP